MQIEFYGAAGEVTGSCHILTVRGKRFLLDCGMIQGGRDATERNRREFPFVPADIDAVVLSHAHIDHSGRLPLLVKRGFRGPIYTNAACGDLLPILWRDTADLGLREVERINRRREPDDPVATPLYELDDVERALKLVRALRYDTKYEPLPGVSLILRDAGHILGSSSVLLECSDEGVQRTIVFSGDLGQYDSPILLDPYPFEQADLVIMESTYGDRLHRDREATLAEFGEIIAAADASRGNLIIPAFAIGRSQEVLYLLGLHYDAWQLCDWQVFLDSPMAIEASEVYWKHVDRYDPEALRLRADFTSMPQLPNLSLCRTADESRAINRVRDHAIIIAGSGMCNGGRVLHHLKHNLPRAECHVVITGFQAPGTLGRALVDRLPAVRIHGELVHVSATVHTLGGLSAHGDQEDLLRWYGNFTTRPPVCLVHGELPQAQALRARLEARGGRAWIPEPGFVLDLATLTEKGVRSS